MAGTSVRDRLLADRRALLDLGTRNRLVHIPLKTKTTRTIDIVGARSATLFEQLGEGKRFTFLPAKPEAIAETSDSASAPTLPLPPPAPPAANDKSADHEADKPSRSPDTRLQTRLSSEPLQKRLLDIWYDARTLEEEQGVNILYLAFGLLKWFEDDKSNTERFAPLVLLPVRLERSSAAERFHLVSRSEPPSPNLSLQAKLNEEFGLRIEDFGDEDDVDIAAYLAGIAETVATKKRWEVKADAIVLGFFSFSKFLMYRDLDPETWPSDGALDRHPLITALLQNGFEASEPIVADNGKIDPVIQPIAMNHVVDADSSQAVVIEEVVRGRDLVVKGPPGTGKSQTITNIIASAAAEGKTVLFVAEKMAALDVVHRRLKAVGLGSLALELHSNKANKRVLLEELKRCKSAGVPAPRGEATLVQRLADSRDSLNQHANMMHQPHQPSELTPFRLLGHLVRCGDSSRQPALPLQDAPSWTPLELERRRELIAELAERIAADGAPHQHPWRGVGRDALDPVEMAELRRSLEDLASVLARVTAGATRIGSLLALASPATLADVTAALAFAEAAAAMPDCDKTAFCESVWSRPQEIADIVDKGLRYAKLKTAFEQAFVDSAWDASMVDCRKVIAEKGGSWLRLLSARYRGQMALLASYLKVPMPKALDQRLLLIDGLIAAQAARKSFDDVVSAGRAAFGTAWQKEQSDWDALAKLTAWWSEFPKPFATDATRQHLAQLTLSAEDRQAIDQLKSDLTSLRSGLQRLIDFLQLEPSRITLDPGDQLRLDALSQTLSEWRSSTERLTRWIAFMERVRLARANGLTALVDRALDGSLPGDALEQTFDNSYYDAMRGVIFAQNPQLKRFDGESHDRLVDGFRKLDIERMQLARDQIAYEHAAALPRNAGGIGPLGVLNGELAKKRNHLPIRQLLERAGPVIQQIKPIFLMSPLSVAQFLKPGAIAFDLLVVDEASQIEPVDALGAVARCRQMVVVGDERQLPPTRFFAKLTGNDDEDADDEDQPTFQVKDAESILDLCLAKGLSHRMLNWHYRSKHQSLIAVSNKQFYDNRLFIVPSPYDAVAGMGLKFNYNPDAHYERGSSRTNPGEARIVAEAVMRHAKEMPERSLGVATFSVAQRQAIQDQLEIMRKESPETEEFFSRGTSEPFFVKNLENIQGDERDVIFISIGYGRTKEGFVSMSFGPLNSDGGERRLNVLISRAKLRCEVFSSITGDDIDLSRAKGHGIAALKTFLTFAQTGQLGIAQETGRDPDSVFEEQVAAKLRALGHDVKTQIGTAGFFVDLAIVDPDKPGRFLLGIECDGAQYHASRSARDRDRLRQNVLEAHGWVLHRIWSTDWFLRPKEETEKVLRAIEAAKAHWREIDEGVTETQSAPPADPQVATPESAEARPAEVAAQTPTAAPYEEVKLRVRREVEPHETSLTNMMRHVVEIVAVEGPVHESEIIVRIRSAWGLARAGNRIRDAVRAALNAAAAKGQIAGGPFYVVPGQTIVVRNREDVQSTTLRKPEMLPPEEIKAAILQVVEQNFGAEEDQLLQAVARLFGFGSTSAQLREAVQSGLRDLLDASLLRRDGELLTKPESSPA
ncbi:very-short-patch-repair endonuclease [Bradyrhizobium sp. USDA 4353]